MRRHLLSVTVGASVTLGALTLLGGCGGDDADSASEAPSAASGDALVTAGKARYEAACAVCHGGDLEGTATGPPFLHEVYVPSHHPDESFFAAVENGVQPHHWDFGAMPAQPGVSRDDVAAIVAYVRAVQREHGIG